MAEYLFDVQLFASITVQADSEDDARNLLNEELRGASCNAGAWPNGDPILFEIAVEDDPDLVSVNGETV
jgi:hypothetical protein